MTTPDTKELRERVVKILTNQRLMFNENKRGDAIARGKAANQILALISASNKEAVVGELKELQRIGKVAFLQSFVDDRINTLKEGGADE